MDIDIPLMLESGTATEMHKLGYDYEKSLDEFILSHTEEFIKLQTEYIKAGSEALLTPTFSTNPYALERFGKDNEAEEINKKLARLTVEAVNRCGKKVLIAGGIGSFDNYDDYSITELMSMYRRQIKAIDRFVDFYFIEITGSIKVLRAALLACKKTDKRVFVSVSGNISPLSALITAQEMGADAFGINCLNGDNVIKNLEEIQPYSKVSLIARSLGESSGIKYVKFDDELKEDSQFIFTNENEVFFLNPEIMEISLPIECNSDLESEISRICSHSYDILRVEINSPDDALEFADATPLSTLPIMFKSYDKLSLKMALLLYQGRAIIDSDTTIEDEYLVTMAQKYGALIY